MNTKWPPLVSQNAIAHCCSFLLPHVSVINRGMSYHRHCMRHTQVNYASQWGTGPVAGEHELVVDGVLVDAFGGETSAPDVRLGLERVERDLVDAGEVAFEACNVQIAHQLLRLHGEATLVSCYRTCGVEWACEGWV